MQFYTESKSLEKSNFSGMKWQCGKCYKRVSFQLPSESFNFGMSNIERHMDTCEANNIPILQEKVRDKMVDRTMWQWGICLHRNLKVFCSGCGVSIELTHLKRPRCWEGLKAGGEAGNRGWDGGCEQTPEDGEGQGSLACCSPQHRRVKHDLVAEQQQYTLRHELCH